MEEIVKKYDKTASTSTCRLAIGGEAFLDWDIPIETCLEYGDSISIFFYPTEFGRFLVYVKNLKGNTITIPINPNSNIEELKRKIQDREEIPADQQRLLYGGKQLEDARTFRDYSIKSESTIHLTIRLRGCGISFANITENGK